MSKKTELIAAITEMDPDFVPGKMTIKDLQAVFDELTAELEEEGGRGMASTMAKYRETYTDSVSPTGRKSLNNGDKIAAILEGRDADEVLAIAEQLLELEKGELVLRYENLNNGQRRMNGGNRIRSAIKRGDHTIKQLEAVVH